MSQKVPKILLVEDNLDDQLLTKMALDIADVAHQLDLVSNGAEALDYLFTKGDYAERDSNDMPSLVLLDLNMPKMGGLEVLRRMRRDPRTRLIPVVILTTSNQEKDLYESYKLGANSYIRKSVDFAEFTETAKQLGTYWMNINYFPVGQIFAE